LSTPGSAQVEQSKDAPTNADNGQRTTDGGQPLEEAARQRALTSAILMLGGVLFIGAMMIVLILLWGFRVRRIARKPLPRSTPIDPLWYLRARQETRLGARDRTESGLRSKHPGDEASKNDEDTDPGTEPLS
jgi:hypothetical protein